jgi:hypothetical protein
MAAIAPDDNLSDSDEGTGYIVHLHSPITLAVSE